MKLLYYVPKAGSYYFAIYYLYYKEKLETTKSVYNFCLLYSNKLVDNLTQTLSYTIKLSLDNKKRKLAKKSFFPAF